MGTIMEFNRFIDDMALFDVQLSGCQYTWSNRRPNPTFSRLDRALISEHWNTSGASIVWSDLPASVSNHVPLMLMIKPHPTAPKRQFKFENFWLRHPEIHDVVRQAWQSAPYHSVSVRRFKNKIIATQVALWRWAGKKFRARETYLSRSKWVLQQVDRVEERRQLTNLEFRLRIRMREHIYELASERECKWKQKSNCRWLCLGDKNTKYFHSLANARKNANVIANLRKDNGSTIPQSEIHRYISDHYGRLLGSGLQNRLPLDLTGKVGPSYLSILAGLDDKIRVEEVHRVVNTMPNDKASGPDGLSIEFY